MFVFGKNFIVTLLVLCFSAVSCDLIDTTTEIFTDDSAALTTDIAPTATSPQNGRPSTAKSPPLAVPPVDDEGDDGIVEDKEDYTEYYLRYHNLTIKHTILPKSKAEQEHEDEFVRRLYTLMGFMWAVTVALSTYAILVICGCFGEKFDPIGGHVPILPSPLFSPVTGPTGDVTATSPTQGGTLATPRSNDGAGKTSKDNTLQSPGDTNGSPAMAGGGVGTTTAGSNTNTTTKANKTTKGDSTKTRDGGKNKKSGKRGGGSGGGGEKKTTTNTNMTGKTTSSTNHVKLKERSGDGTSEDTKKKSKKKTPSGKNKVAAAAAATKTKTEKTDNTKSVG